MKVLTIGLFLASPIPNAGPQETVSRTEDPVAIGKFQYSAG
jgi:hypothetical protein